LEILLKKEKFSTLLLILFLVVPCLMMPVIAVGQDNTGDQAEESKGTIERTQEKLSNLVMRSADVLDRFFGDDRHSSFEENTTRLRLQFDVDYIEDHGWELTPKVRLHLVLPRTMNRLRLVANEEDDQDTDTDRSDVDHETDLALRWIGFSTDWFTSSFDVGMRYKDDNLAGFLRLNLQSEYDLGWSWGGRSTGRFYWYSDTGFRIDLRQYFERYITDQFFFRSRTRVQWWEEESGAYPQQRFTLFHRLNEKNVLAYEVQAKVIPASDSNFEIDEILQPDDRYTGYWARIRYRTNVRWPWLYFELWPAATFPEELDYELTWSVRFRIEINLGHTPTVTAEYKD
jgi:hypothetical protein